MRLIFIGSINTEPAVKSEEHSYCDDGSGRVYLSFNYYISQEFERDSQKKEYLHKIYLNVLYGSAKIYLKQGNDISYVGEITEDNKVLFIDEAIELTESTYQIIIKPERSAVEARTVRSADECHTYISDSPSGEWILLQQGENCYETSLYVYTANEVVTSVSMESFPERLVYAEGEELDLSGGSLKIAFADGTEKIVTLTDEGMYVYGANTNKLGMQTISVGYGGKIDTFTIAVSEKERHLKIPSLDVREYAYNGEKIEPVLVGYDEDLMVTSGDFSAVDVGSYEMQISLKDDKNYCWVSGDDSILVESPIIYQWIITKTIPQIIVSNTKQQEKDGITPVQVSVFPKITDGDIEISYSMDGGKTYTNELPTKNGIYPIKIWVQNDKNLEDTIIEDVLIVEEKNVMKGDVNGDGKVTLIDVRLAIQKIVNRNYSESDNDVLDYNQDGKISLLDARLLLQAVVNR